MEQMPGHRYSPPYTSTNPTLFPGGYSIGKGLA
jgi:hypothetical protein